MASCLHAVLNLSKFPWCATFPCTFSLLIQRKMRPRALRLPYTALRAAGDSQPFGVTDLGFEKGYIYLINEFSITSPLHFVNSLSLISRDELYKKHMQARMKLTVAEAGPLRARQHYRRQCQRREVTEELWGAGSRISGSLMTWPSWRPRAWTTIRRSSCGPWVWITRLVFWHRSLLPARRYRITRGSALLRDFRCD